MTINEYIKYMNHYIDDKDWKTVRCGSLRHSDTDGYWLESNYDWFRRDDNAMAVKIEVREPYIDTKELKSLL